MDKIDGIPFHGTPPSQKKNINNTVSSTPFSSKLGNIAGQAAYYGGMAALGIAGRGVARGAVHAGRAAFYQRAGQMAGRVAQAAARHVVRWVHKIVV